MAKLESSFKNMVLVLFAVTCVSASVLGALYNLTEEPIRLAKEAKEAKAIQQAVPVEPSLADKVEIEKETYCFDMVSNEVVPRDKEASVDKAAMDSLLFFTVNAEGKELGTAIKTFSNGFNGRIDLMVGFDPEGVIIDILVLGHTETPGLGTKMADPGFKDQFKEKNPSQFEIKVKKKGGDVDAITAATISSSAFCRAVDRAYRSYKTVKGK